MNDLSGKGSPQSIDAATVPVCAFEARLALMRAALRACVARENHDDEQLVVWRLRAGGARYWLRRAA